MLNPPGLSGEPIFPEKKSSRSGHFFIEFTTQIPPTIEKIIQTASHPTTVIESAY